MNNYKNNLKKIKNKPNNQYYSIINNSNQNFKNNYEVDIVRNESNLNIKNNYEVDIVRNESNLNIKNNYEVDIGIVRNESNLNIKNNSDIVENNIIDIVENDIVENDIVDNDIVEYYSLDKDNIIKKDLVEYYSLDKDNIIENNSDWDIVEYEPKWNFINELNYKDKIKIQITNKYNKIMPLLYYSLKILTNSKYKNYMNILSNTSSIINNKCNNIVNNNVLDILDKNNVLNILDNHNLLDILDNFKLSINKLQYYITPFVESIKLQYNYNQAFHYAYINMINICYNLLLPFIIEINNKLYNYYENEISINNLNTEFFIIYNNYKYIFIYHQFLLNLAFQLDLQKYIKKSILNLNLTFRINENNNFIFKIIYFI